MWIVLMVLLVLVLGGAAVGGGLVLAARRRAQLGSGERPALGSGGATALLERTLRDVCVGDVVQLEGRDFLVEGVVQYDEDGHQWAAARVVDVHDERWLVVGHERGGGNTVRLMKVEPSIEISGYPPEQIDADGAKFTQDKRGTATASVSGETGLTTGAPAESAIRCRWWRYETAGDKSLIIEQWGGTFRVLLGAKIKPEDVDLMAAS